MKTKEMKILNFTQHVATAEQKNEGIVEPSKKKEIQELLTFSELPDMEEMRKRAKALVKLTTGYKAVMIGGAPYFMSTLEKELKKRDKIILYAFSKRISSEKKDENGNIIKVNTFKHIGFVNVK